MPLIKLFCVINVNWKNGISCVDKALRFDEKNTVATMIAMISIIRTTKPHQKTTEKLVC